MFNHEENPKARYFNGEVYSNYLVVVAHCVLNQATRWFWNNESGAWTEGFISDFLEKLKMMGVGLYQLPCPEFSLLGNPRRPMTRDEYEVLPGFVDHCRTLAKNTLRDLKAFKELSTKPKIVILAIIGIEGSPSCGVEFTSRKITNTSVRLTGRGIFMEILEELMSIEGMNIPFFGLDGRRLTESISNISHLLEKRIKELV
ncbi:MAG: 2-thiouracil desulfurase family protein [Candidatus Bathyarchaeia archaeon]